MADLEEEMSKVNWGGIRLRREEDIFAAVRRRCDIDGGGRGEDEEYAKKIGKVLG